METYLIFKVNQIQEKMSKLFENLVLLVYQRLVLFGSLNFRYLGLGKLLVSHVLVVNLVVVSKASYKFSRDFKSACLFFGIFGLTGSCKVPRKFNINILDEKQKTPLINFGLLDLWCCFFFIYCNEIKNLSYQLWESFFFFFVKRKNVKGRQNWEEGPNSHLHGWWQNHLAHM